MNGLAIQIQRYSTISVVSTSHVRHVTVRAFALEKQNMLKFFFYENEMFQINLMPKNGFGS